MESLIIGVLEKHPEILPSLHSTSFQQENYTNDENPFLHLGLHVALAEQLQANRPVGIRTLYAKICEKFTDQHEAEHRILEVLAHYIVTEMKQAGSPENERSYLENLEALV